MFLEQIESPEQYAYHASNQLQSILHGVSSKQVWFLTGSEWRYISCRWLLIQRGVFLPDMMRRHIDWLRSDAVRSQADHYIRTHSLTMESAASAIGCQEELAKYHEIEAERPILHG